jgi:hypothetical protein
MPTRREWRVGLGGGRWGQGGSEASGGAGERRKLAVDACLGWAGEAGRGVLGR